MDPHIVKQDAPKTEIIRARDCQVVDVRTRCHEAYIMRRLDFATFDEPQTPKPTRGSMAKVSRFKVRASRILSLEGSHKN
jgi:hypothetical protein